MGTAARKDQRSGDSSPQPTRYLFSLVLIVGVLYVGRPVVIPLALALLFTFILTPLVISVQRRGLPRTPAVLAVVGLTVFILGVIGYGVGKQLTMLAEDLPAHADQIHEKIKQLRASGTGPVSRMIDSFRDMGDADKIPAANGGAPAATVVSAPQESALQRLTTVAAAVVEPVADAALVTVLVIFMLVKREDLRNRVIGLLGHGRLTGTTRVFVQSAERISKLLLMQLCVNAGFGVIFGFALLIIGVQYAFLWAFLTAILRFVPYIGSWIAAAFPVLLSFAMAPGLAQPVEVLAVFLTLDLLTANAVEPLLFSHSTGVSPVALLIAAVFWTWVWGPIGLILSTPLTICLVVLGQHVPRFRFLALMLGDQPALDPHIAFYQRLLAADETEALLIARQHSTLKGSENLADDVLVPALRLTRRDRATAGLSAEDESLIFESVSRTVDQSRPKPTEAVVATVASPAEMASLKPLVLGCAAHHRAEELTLEMLGLMLVNDCRMHNVSTRTLPSEIEAIVSRDQPAVVFISVMPPGGLSQARYLSRRLRKRFANLNIVVGYFGKVRNFDRLLIRLRSAGASYVATSMLQCRGQVVTLLPKVQPLAGTTIDSSALVMDDATTAVPA